MPPCCPIRNGPIPCFSFDRQSGQHRGGGAGVADGWPVSRMAVRGVLAAGPGGSDGPHFAVQGALDPDAPASGHYSGEARGRPDRHRRPCTPVPSIGTDDRLSPGRLGGHATVRAGGQSAVESACRPGPLGIEGTRLRQRGEFRTAASNAARSPRRRRRLPPALQIPGLAAVLPMVLVRLCSNSARDRLVGLACLGTGAGPSRQKRVVAVACAGPSSHGSDRQPPAVRQPAAARDRQPPSRFWSNALLSSAKYGGAIISAVAGECWKARRAKARANIRFPWLVIACGHAMKSRSDRQVCADRGPIGSVDQGTGRKSDCQLPRCCHG